MDKVYLAAISGGADSMALLDMAYKAGLNIVAVHVNYQKRQSAWRDQKIVADYCFKHNIPLYVNYAASLNGNFQSAARDLRYAFFKKIAAIYRTDYLLVAHQLDDYLENVLMMLERGSSALYFGIKKRVRIYGLKVYRPLLKYTKKDLEHYCISHNIAYGIDESNLTYDYARNAIRHNELSKFAKKDKEALFAFVESINTQRSAIIADYLKKYQKDVYELKEFSKIKDKDLFLRIKLSRKLSKKELTEIKNELKKAKSFKRYCQKRWLIKEYDKIYFIDELYDDYRYVINDLKPFSTPYFKITTQSDRFRCCKVEKSDFPLLIRNFQKGDVIKMRYGKKKISRYFIDQKIPLYKRHRWPIVLNSQNEIILVPGIGCNIDHYSINPNFFMIELLNMRGESEHAC